MARNIEKDADDFFDTIPCKTRKVSKSAETDCYVIFMDSGFNNRKLPGACPFCHINIDIAFFNTAVSATRSKNMFTGSCFQCKGCDKETIFTNSLLFRKERFNR